LFFRQLYNRNMHTKSLWLNRSHFSTCRVRFPGFKEMRSDNTFFTIYSADRGTSTSAEAMAEFIDNNISNQEPNHPGNRYGNDYSGIATVNTILTRLPKSTLTQADKDQVSGEALFLRAFFITTWCSTTGAYPCNWLKLPT